MEVVLPGAVFSSAERAKPVLIGSLFYRGDSCVINHGKGIFNKGMVKALLENVRDLKERAGVSHAVEIVAETPQAMESYLEFMADRVEEPLLIGGVTEHARIAGYRKAAELGIQNRCIANSLSRRTSKKELEELHDCRIAAAVVQLNGEAFKVEEKLHSFDVARKRISQSYSGGLLADVGVIDLSTIPVAVKIVKVLKRRGIPVGCSPANVAYQLHSKGLLELEEARALNSALTAILQLAGASFIMYGPLKAAEYIFALAKFMEILRMRMGEWSL